MASHTQCFADVTEKMEELSHGNNNLVPYETIVRVTSREPEAMEECSCAIK